MLPINQPCILGLDFSWIFFYFFFHLSFPRYNIIFPLCKEKKRKERAFFHENLSKKIRGAISGYHVRILTGISLKNLVFFGKKSWIRRNILLALKFFRMLRALFFPILMMKGIEINGLMFLWMKFLSHGPEECQTRSYVNVFQVDGDTRPRGFWIVIL